MASISLRNITKVFDRRIAAVANLSLEVCDGEFLVIVGPSGCGKTTILRLIAGLESPTSGEIRIGDRIVNDIPPRDRDVAMVFQEGVLYPHMDVFANLAFPLRMRKQPEAEVRRRVGTAAEMLALKDLLDRRPAALSGGQRQRVALGRALVREPAAFLFDEPLSSLDAALRLAMRAEIRALHQRLRTTMLYVTHDQSEAMALGERIGVLRDGRLQQVGRPGDIYERPGNRFIAGFFGAPPMNLLAGRVRYENEAGFLDLGTARIGLPLRLLSHLTDYQDKTVVAGIRPHDVSLEPLPGHRDNVLTGRVTLIEPFGSRADVHVELSPSHKCVISAPPNVLVNVGDEARVYINPDKVHLFEDDESGWRISPDTSGH